MRFVRQDHNDIGISTNKTGTSFLRPVYAGAQKRSCRFISKHYEFVRRLRNYETSILKAVMTTLKQPSLFYIGFIGLTVSVLASCNSREAGSPPSTTNPTTSQPTVSVPPSVLPEQSPSVPQLTGQDIGCSTPQHFAEVTWQTGQPRLTFGRKPDGITLYEGTPISVVDNPDGSRTYGHQGELTAYARFYLSGQCLLQSLDSQGKVVVEEFGSIGNIGAVRAVAPPSPEPIPSPDRPIVQEPNQDNLSMTCSGNIQNRVDFTVFFTREAGFSRIELKPRTSNTTLTAYMSYDGKNDQGQAIWRGNVNQMATVTLVHLSTAPAQRGDEVSVGYDNQWGRATCQ